MTRLALSLPPGYVPAPGPAPAPATTPAAPGVVTAGALALDGSTTAWLTVTVTAMVGAPPDGGRIDDGIVEVLRTRYPAADVRPVALPAGPAVRIEQRGRLDLPGGRVEVTDVRHLLPVPGGRDVVTVALRGGDVDPGLLGDAADRTARGLRVEDGAP